MGSLETCYTYCVPIVIKQKKCVKYGEGWVKITYFSVTYFLNDPLVIG